MIKEQYQKIQGPPFSDADKVRMAGMFLEKEKPDHIEIYEDLYKIADKLEHLELLTVTQQHFV